jgi:ADP-ribosylglycohydrolase
MKRNEKHFRGCLLGGDIGDALGWPVEFLTAEQIKKRYGDTGITDLQLGPGGKAEITDDTQMTLFTAEGLLRGYTRGNEKGICHLPTMVYHSYLRWLYTQGYPKREDLGFIYNSWLLGIEELHQQRGPGHTCLSALSSGTMGTIEEPINDSKGCGGVMRSAPVGLICRKENAFELACECAALTHGHPSGYLSAGVLAHIVVLLIEGMDLEDAVLGALEVLETYPGHEECTAAVKKAVELSQIDTDPSTAIRVIGKGWVGEEAIGIAVYCALKYKSDFRQALVVSVNHNGDSDSTGAITGNILGAYLGLGQIPKEWIDKVEFFDVLIQIADDLLAGYEDSDEWRKRYSGY